MRTMLMIAALGCAAFAQDDDKRKFEEFKKESLRKEDAGAFRKIAWQKDMAAALEKAKTDARPILVFLIVGHLAKKDAAEC